MASSIPSLSYEYLRERADPQFDNLWYTEYIPEGLRSDYLESVDIPFSNISVAEPLFAAGSFTYFPSTHAISAFSATFYEDQQMSSTAWINRWKNKVKNLSTGAYGLPSDYKRDWIISLLNCKHETVMTVKLIGVWPSNTSNFALNYTSNGRLVLTQEFSVDDQELLFINYPNL